MMFNRRFIFYCRQLWDAGECGFLIRRSLVDAQSRVDEPGGNHHWFHTDLTQRLWDPRAFSPHLVSVYPCALVCFHARVGIGRTADWTDGLFRHWRLRCVMCAIVSV